MTASLLAIDPGITAGCACAAFAEKRLVCVWFERIGNAMQSSKHVSIAFDTVLVERPVYQGGRTLAARAQDLMSLAWEGALLAGSYAGRDNAFIVEWAANDTGEARGWKGSEPKPVQHARLWDSLAADERALLGGERTGDVIMATREKGALARWGRPGASFYPRAFIAHNLLDAVALGCTYLGRFERTA